MKSTIAKLGLMAILASGTSNVYAEKGQSQTLGTLNHKIYLPTKLPEKKQDLSQDNQQKSYSLVEIVGKDQLENLKNYRGKLKSVGRNGDYFREFNMEQVETFEKFGKKTIVGGERYLTNKTKSIKVDKGDGKQQSYQVGKGIRVETINVFFRGGNHVSEKEGEKMAEVLKKELEGDFYGFSFDVSNTGKKLGVIGINIYKILKESS